MLPTSLAGPTFYQPRGKERVWSTLFQLAKDLVAGMRKRHDTSRLSNGFFRACTCAEISLVIIYNRKKKRLHGPGCASAKGRGPRDEARYLQELHWKNFRHFLTRKLFPSLLPLS